MCFISPFCLPLPTSLPSYLASQEYKQHFDAFDLGTEDGRRFAENGGQRVATVRREGGREGSRDECHFDWVDEPETMAEARGREGGREEGRKGGREEREG